MLKNTHAAKLSKFRVILLETLNTHTEHSLYKIKFNIKLKDTNARNRNVWYATEKNNQVVIHMVLYQHYLFISYV